MKNSQPDWAAALEGFWNKKARLGKGDNTQQHQMFCAIGLMKHGDEIIFSRASRSVKHSWSAVQYLTSPPWLSPCANRDTTNTARASTAPHTHSAGTPHHSTCHMPGHLKHAEKFISFQAHNSFYVRLITLLHLQANFRIKPCNSFLIVSLNQHTLASSLYFLNMSCIRW